MAWASLLLVLIVEIPLIAARHQPDSTPSNIRVSQDFKAVARPSKGYALVAQTIEPFEGAADYHTKLRARKEDAAPVGQTLLCVMISLLASALGMTIWACPTVWRFLRLICDNVIAVLFAILLYHTFMEFVQHPQLSNEWHQWQIFCGIVHCAALIAFLMLVSSVAKGTSMDTVVFCGVGMHYLPAVSSRLQLRLGAEDRFVSSFLACGAGLLGLALSVALVSTVAAIARRASNQKKDEIWHAKADAAENDLGAATAAGLWSIAARGLLAGAFVDGPAGDGAHVDETARRCLLVYVFVISALATVFLPLFRHLRVQMPRSYLVRRAMMFGASFLSSAATWAFTLWGQWHLAAAGAASTLLIVTTAVAALAVVTLMLCPADVADNNRGDLGQEQRAALMAVSVAIAWALAEAVCRVGAATRHGMAGQAGDDVPQALLLAAATCVSLPLYCTILRPGFVLRS